MVWHKSANLKYFGILCHRISLPLSLVHNIVIAPYYLLSNEENWSHIVVARHSTWSMIFSRSKIPWICSPCISASRQKWLCKILHFSIKSKFKVFEHWKWFQYWGYTIYMPSNNSSQVNSSLISDDSDFSISIKLHLTEITTSWNHSIDMGHYLVGLPILSL